MTTLSPLPPEALDPYGAMLSRADPPPAGAGPLAGLRLCVKDNIAVAGEPFTAGHPLYAGRRARSTAPAVARLLAAGARFAGMTRTDAGGFGMTTDAVINPHAPGLTVGGSSGGAAAAVAAALADLGLGTDTGGSIRVPAACTGLYGFKPSFGRVGLDGVIPLAPSFDHAGLLARDLPTLARGAALLLDDDSLLDDAPPDDAPLTLAVETDLSPLAAPEVRARFEAVLARLRAAGVQTVPVALPDRAALAADFGLAVVREAAALHDDLPPEKRACLGEAARKALALPPVDMAAWIACAARLDAARAAYQRALGRLPLLLSPTLLIPPPPRGIHVLEREGRRTSVLSAFLAGTCFANLTGRPALSLPLPGGPFPFALHLAGRTGADAELLRAARRLHALLAEDTG